MSIFTEIAAQYAIADRTFGSAEQAAFEVDDDAAFDLARDQRQRNDQAYFLYLFTRLEHIVNQEVEAILTRRTSGSVAWAERRIWEAWARQGVKDIHFMSKMEVLADKGRSDYATIKRYYEGRNEIAHGGIWTAQFVVPSIAQSMDEIVARFAGS